MQIVKINRANATVSLNGLYIIGTDSTRLWVAKEQPDPRYCMPDGIEQLKHNGTTYRPFATRRDFVRDCLHSAEEIMHDADFPLLPPAVRSQVGADAFGDQEAANIQIANDQRGQPTADAGADPGAGQAYAIISTVPGSVYPYHAAAVVATDGADKITLEVFARGADARDDDRKARGVFQMYDTGAHSFHDTWCNQGYFTGTNPVTVVLTPR